MRKAFKIKILPENIDEYIRRHNPIWKELELTLKKYGVSNYSIFLDKKTGNLFGYLCVQSETSWKEISSTIECQNWWVYMSEIMPTNPDYSPLLENLEEIFYLE